MSPDAPDRGTTPFRRVWYSVAMSLDGYIAQGGGSSSAKTYVFSRTLEQADHPDVTIVAGDPASRE